MPMTDTPGKIGRRDTTAATLASNATFAKRRARKAIAELDRQDYLVLPPGTVLPPEIAALVVRP